MEIIDDLVNQPWFKNKKTLSIYSQGLTQSTDATDKVNALINAITWLIILGMNTIIQWL
jgi:assimilatory nitrate reductase catalytic subunit